MNCSDKPKRIRSRNFTLKEKEILSKLIYPNNYIVRNKSADKDSKDLRRRTWQSIYENFKTLNHFKTERTLDQIKIYWKNQLSKKINSDDIFSFNNYHKNDESAFVSPLSYSSLSPDGNH
ncbi:hypothetical protein MXB_4500 [Myxobolus squamalis]|nr:hypothetical protein MXB_4500 [Myxobolus squamalis]